MILWVCRRPKYDHNIFPGAIPRTFVGCVLLSWLCMPFVHVGITFGVIASKFDLQFTLRLVLASFNAFALILIRRAASARFGKQTSWLYALLTCSQFHLPFWMGRTLPNMFALVPVNLAHYMLYHRAPNSVKASKRSINTAIALLTFTAVVLRSEVVLLLAPLALQLLIQGHTTILELVRAGLLAGLTSAAITIVVDSYFWNQWPVWSELYGLYFNVYLGKSAGWGTSPAHTYFTAYLPKLLLGCVPMAILGAALDHRIRSMLLAPVVFVSLLSALGHKEWRFVIYIVPLFNIAAARGARWMTSRKKGLFRYLVFVTALALIALNFLVTFISTQASTKNYPVHVHISNLAAQTGASLFLYEQAPPFVSSLQSSEPHLSHPSWTYNKTESLTPSMISTSSFTHLIAESPEMSGMEWTVVEAIPAFKGWRLNSAVLTKLKTGKVWEIPLDQWARVLEMEMENQLWILERRAN
ncbi:glycosyltransferase family 22 protein [Chiua virens]|nr:glycosyltransferase family 22 protein [Chiua virens]